MTFPEAMTKARKEADDAIAAAKKQDSTSPHAYAVGALTVTLALTYRKLAAAEAEVKRHQSFIRTQ